MTDAGPGALVALVCSDLGAIVRGRSMPSSDFARQRAPSVGWVPSAHGRPPFGPSVRPNPFGTIGDLRLVADPDTYASIGEDDGGTRLSFVLCDLVEVDGRPWAGCPRAFLRETLDELERELGARASTAFEHEFQLLLDAPPPPPLSLEAQRRVDPFPELATAALVEAGLAPERFLPESSPYQYEIPIAAAEGLAGADRSVALQVVVREIARRQGMRATFVPLADPGEKGNGVHVNLNLLDAGGDSLLYDPDRPGCLSELGGRFAAGILAHARALSALTAPSPVSCARLRPHQASAGAVCLGRQNREALLRIPPLVTLGGADPAAQMRLEYRGADAAANPYLALGGILKAGLSGVRRRLPVPPLLEHDIGDLDAEDAERFGVGKLPATLDDSLRALADDGPARRWMAPLLYDGYTSVKRAELEAVAGQELDRLCRRYAEIY